MNIDIERLKRDLGYWNSVAPEGATHYGPESSAWTEAWYKEDGDEWSVLGADIDPVVAEHEGKARSLIPRPSPSWDGDGLPPVGTDCEVQHEQFGWTGATVVAHFGSCAVCAPNGGGFYGYAKDECRPLKSEKDRVVEAVESLYSGESDPRVMHGIRIALETAYDAGALKMPEGE